MYLPSKIEDGFYLPKLEYCSIDENGEVYWYTVMPTDEFYGDKAVEQGLYDVFDVWCELLPYSKELCNQMGIKHSSEDDNEIQELWNFTESLKDQLANSIDHLFTKEN